MSSLVSIIIPTFNRAHLLGETLDSLIKQSYSNWECILVDDGSDDETQVVAESYIKRDERFFFFNRPILRVKGPSSCRNYGFEQSKGEFIQWLDSDDLLHEDKFTIDLKYLQNEDIDFTISQSVFFDHNTKEELRLWNSNLFSEDPINDFILKKIGWGVNSALWRREVLVNKKLAFNELLQNRNDYFFHLEALVKGLKPFVINDVLAFQREHMSRIQNKSNKAPAKAIVNHYLLSNSLEIGLNDITLEMLRTQSLLILIRFYKYKTWGSAVKFSWKLFKLPNQNRQLYAILRLLFFGTIYKTMNKGYDYLNFH